jgi:iron(III) transport system ATP-binding protein
MYKISIKSLDKSFGKTRVLKDVSLEVAEGELFFLLGPSGCGKTTLLRILAGFEQPDRGSVLFNGTDVTTLAPQKRNASMVFQSYALWPHLTVSQNVAFGLENQQLAGGEIREKILEVLKLVQLEGYGHRLPAQLSGGQQQRVALARALVVGPQLLLLDEPLSNLDARLRAEMRLELKRLHQKTGVTAVYVTHDQEEALSLADRIAFLDNGEIAQVGTPRNLYARPATVSAARFLGAANIAEGTVKEIRGNEALVDTDAGLLRASIAEGRAPAAGQNVFCFFRPESMKPASDAGNTITGRVTAHLFNGGHETVYLTRNGFEFRASVSISTPIATGAEMSFGLDTADVIVLNR